MIAQHMGGLPSAYPPIATTSASGPSANAPGATRLVERRHRAVAGEVALYAQCGAGSRRYAPLSLSPPDEALETWSYVAPLKMHDLNIRPFACKVLGH